MITNQIKDKMKKFISLVVVLLLSFGMFAQSKSSNIKISKPLSITDTYIVKDTIINLYAMYVDISEPSTVTLFLRKSEHAETQTPWAAKSLSIPRKYQAIGIKISDGFGTNTSWDYYLTVTNKIGASFTTPIETFKTQEVDIRNLVNPNQG